MLSPDPVPQPAAMSRIIPMVVAAALLMENLDSTVLTTAIPTIAPDLGTDPVHLKLVLTAYLMSLAVFVPASGWMADRFGARRVFMSAIALFTVASLLCSLAQSLPQLVAARILQGVGGAMMTPVGRLVVVRAVAKRDLVNALAWVTIPALIGPILGPPVGGLVVSYANWRWIFLINLPIGLIGIALAWRFLPDVDAGPPRPFDRLGFVLSGGGLSLMVIAAAFLGAGGGDLALAGASAVLAAILLTMYARHAARAAFPILDVGLLRIPTLRASVIGGSLFRSGVSASPFLLPLLLQIGFGLDPLSSGLITFASGAGALMMKFTAKPILDALGFRRALILNGTVSASLMLAPLLFSASTPGLVISAALFGAGFLRSLQMTAMNALAFADVPEERMSGATTLTAVGQQVAASFGVSIAAIALQAARATHGHDALTIDDFRVAFVVVTVVALLSVVSFLRLKADAGQSLVSRAKVEDETETRP